MNNKVSGSWLLIAAVFLLTTVSTVVCGRGEITRCRKLHTNAEPLGRKLVCEAGKGLRFYGETGCCVPCNPPCSKREYAIFNSSRVSTVVSNL